MAVNVLSLLGDEKGYAAYRRELDEKIEAYRSKGFEVPGPEMIKTPEQIEGIRVSGVINTGILDYLAAKVKVGMNTGEIDEMVYDFTVKRGAIPAPLNFMGFPKSCCTSVNDEVCHGIPDKSVILKSGDIVNIDVSTIYNGYYSDASRMYLLGQVDKKKKDLTFITGECMRRGIEAVQPWGFLGDIGAVVAAYAHKHGYSVVEEFGGHGVGIEFHEEPFVCHTGKKKTGMLLVPGMVFTIEPMINMGKKALYVDEGNGWTAYTLDGLPSAQWESTVCITENGPVILTN